MSFAASKEGLQVRQNSPQLKAKKRKKKQKNKKKLRMQKRALALIP